MKNTNKLYIMLAIVLVAVVVLGVAYAAMSKVLTITSGKVTQSALSWNVAFDTASTTVNATAGGTSATGRTCGAATVSASTLTFADTTLSKPGDTCTWSFTIKNTGSIAAKVSGFAYTKPVSSCTTSGATMTCGKLTYKITTNGSTELAQNSTIAAGGTQAIKVVASYNDNSNLLGSAATYSGTQIKITYTQA